MTDRCVETTCGQCGKNYFRRLWSADPCTFCAHPQSVRHTCAVCRHQYPRLTFESTPCPKCAAVPALHGKA